MKQNNSGDHKAEAKMLSYQGQQYANQIHHLCLTRIQQETPTLQAIHHWHPIPRGEKENPDRTLWPLGGMSTPFLSSPNISFIRAFPKYQHYKIQNSKCLTLTKKTNSENIFLIKNAACNFLHKIFWYIIIKDYLIKL